MAEAKKNGKRMAGSDLGSVLSGMIDRTDLSDSQKDLIRARWLQELLRSDRQVRRDRTWFYALRIPVVVGAATLPAIVNLKVSDKTVWGGWALLLSVAGAIGASLEGGLPYGPRWR